MRPSMVCVDNYIILCSSFQAKNCRYNLHPEFLSVSAEVTEKIFGSWCWLVLNRLSNLETVHSILIQAPISLWGKASFHFRAWPCTSLRTVSRQFEKQWKIWEYTNCKKQQTRGKAYNIIQMPTNPKPNMPRRKESMDAWSSTFFLPPDLHEFSSCWVQEGHHIWP